MRRLSWLPLLALTACLVNKPVQPPPQSEPSPAPAAETPHRKEPVKTTSTKVAPVEHRSSAETSNADPRAVAEATELLKQGLAAYHLGAYDEAENLLKRSITAYPFLAQANLALGKVFLLKGAAHRDETMIESARLMFDMAHNIDPSLREPLVLLELFKPR